MTDIRFCQRARPGFLILDVLLGLTVLTIFVGFAGSALLFSQQASIKSGDRVRAAFLSRQAIEAARSIRDENFDSLQAGTFGVKIGEDGKWEFTESPVTTEDGYTTTVTVSVPEEDRVQVSAETTWSFGTQRSGAVSLATKLANWRQLRPIGNWSVLSLVGSFIDETPPLFNSVAISGDYAFVTSETTSGGAGLYVFDISNPAYPSRVAEGFSLGADGYELVVSGNVLFVLTGLAGSEVQAYDISTPDTFSEEKLLGSYNLPGSGRARSIALFGDTIFVGATESVDYYEFFSLDVSDPADITLLDSIDDEGGYLDLSIHDGFAYVGSSKDVAELIVVDVFDPSDLQFASGVGYNLTDDLDGKAVKAFGDYILLGRAYGDVIQELVLFDIESNPVPQPPPPYPWYRGIGEDVNSVDADPTSKYAFVASQKDGMELQVMDVELFREGQLPLLTEYDSDTGVGRSVTYDINLDRLFFTTNSAFLIFAPAP